MSTDVSTTSAATGTDDPRVAELVARMTLEEKLAQLVGLWEGRGGSGEGGDVAPMQDAMQDDESGFEDFARHGLGQLTRPFGTAPVDPVEGARALAAKQRWLTEHTRLGIPALVHEECLTGLAAWKATTFPAPLAWGASFHPELVEEMGAAIGGRWRSLGVHQGLAPVLDVVRDARWGRVEECISEDPYLVGTVGTAYVRGVQSTGVVATLKHFVGLLGLARPAATSHRCTPGRGRSPTCCCPRSRWPCSTAASDSVMHSYAEIDGVPVAADAGLLTGVLRERWGFDGHGGGRLLRRRVPAHPARRGGRPR